ncbi:Trans-aconitate decarboxylase 1 [Paramyrothecium foliicola]|nr:Trans-aconitate decarboxylase 1 [Paramyrothecium foliicola]
MSAATVFDSVLFGNIFGTEEIRECFSERAYVARLIEAECALAQAQEDNGLIPTGVASTIRQHSDVSKIDWPLLAQRAEIVGYPILGLVEQMSSWVPEETSGYIHWGATTQDIMDLASVLQAKQGIAIVERLVHRVAHTLESMSATYRDVPMAGRTHLQHALPITFGYKCAVWLSGMRRHIERLTQLKERCLMVQFGGAAGTLASLGPTDVGIRVRQRMAEILGLRDPVITWHVARDTIAEIVNFLAVLGGSLGKIALDLIIMSSNELNEVAEPYVPHRGASSTMPQKRNPISSEVILAQSKILRAQAGLVLDGMVSDFERASGPWHLEWTALPTAFISAVGSLHQTDFALSGLQVNKDAMMANLTSTKGLIVAEAVMMGLAVYIGRQEAHEVVYRACVAAHEGNASLQESLTVVWTIMKRYSREVFDRSSPPSKRQQNRYYSPENDQQSEARLASRPAISKSDPTSDHLHVSHNISVHPSDEAGVVNKPAGADDDVVVSTNDRPDALETWGGSRGATRTSTELDALPSTHDTNVTIRAKDQHPDAEHVFRVRGIALDLAKSNVISTLEENLPDGQAKIDLQTLALDANGRSQVATLRFTTFPGESSPLTLLERAISQSQRPWKADKDFHGLTVLHCPPADAHTIDIVAISGLGGHAYGSFKEKSGKHMWLSNSLPGDVPFARIAVYGYASGLANSTSFQNLGDLGKSFAVSIQILKKGNELRRPTIFIAHSLGGLVLKEAIIQLSKWKTIQASEALHSIYGALFFGVPNDGLGISSFIPMAGDGPNRFFLESLGQNNSEILKLLRTRFSDAFSFEGSSEIHCFYETELSRTAKLEQSGKWSMNGELRVLVAPSSATHCRPWEDKDDYTYPMQRNHSNLVKLGLHDPDYDTVLHVIEGVAQRAIHREGHQTIDAESPRRGSKTSKLDEHQKQILLDSLRFDQIDARHDTIKKAHGKTCSWLLRRPEYLDWSDDEKLKEHHGFLWIKGKPGAGKSTLMKYILNAALKKKKKMNGEMVISFFFNARGDDLEKSTTGMYRSLLLQLLEQIPNTIDIFDSDHSQKGGAYYQWNVESLKEVFEKAVLQLEGASLSCFIDALDECDEDQIRDMVSFLEQLSQRTSSARVKVRICFSSRHYPHISISTALELVLEGQEGHEQDIISYLNSELKIGQGKVANQVRDELKEKASGIFIWVVLVVRILQKEYDDGRKHTLRQKLRDIPRDLHQLFHDILTRDQHHKDEMLLCIQWILFAKRPLRPEELYFAILSDLDPIAICDWHPGETEETDALKFILSSSKGLAETTKSKPPKVQFIHESVREFLLKAEGLGVVWPELKESFESRSHERLKNCCLDYMKIGFAGLRIETFHYKAEATAVAEARQLAVAKFPFLEYAVQNILHHSDAAQGGGVDQRSFLQSFAIAEWIKYDNLYEKHNVRRHKQGASLSYILAEQNRSNLVLQWMTKGSCFQVEDERYGAPIIAALATDGRATIYNLLKIEAAGEPSDSPLHGICEELHAERTSRGKIGRDFEYGRTRSLLVNLAKEGEEGIIAFLLASGMSHDQIDLSDRLGRTPLIYAAANGHKTLVSLLLECGAEINIRDSEQRAALSWAAESGHEAVVKLLIGNGAVINEGDRFGQTPLLLASEGGHEAVVKLLTENGALINKGDKFGRSPLLWASEGGHEAVIRFLSENDSTLIDQGDADGQTPLLWASKGGHEAVVKLLVEKGAVINKGDRYGQTPLSWASTRGHEAVVKLLVEKGAVINKGDVRGQTPLSWASKGGHEAVVKLLLANGAPLETWGEWPLLWAAELGHQNIVQLLLDKGVQIDAPDNEGKTPLSRAVRNGHAETVRLLLDKGAAVNFANDRGETPLLTAVRLSSMAIVRLLLENNAAVNGADETSCTPLMSAAGRGYEAKLQALLEKGASTEAEDVSGRTSLVRAARCGRKATVQLLLSYGAHTEAADKLSRTALSWAAKNGHQQVVELLLEHGAQAGTVDKSGQTPFDLASRKGHNTIVRLLQDHMAKLQLAVSPSRLLL